VSRANSRSLAALLAALLLSLLVGCAGGGRGGRLPETASVASRLVLISVSGLSAQRLEDGSMPTLASMAAAGAVASHVKGVAPASDHPAHATLVTGAPPAQHGIVSERRLGDRGVRSAGYDHASLLRAHTLWERAVAAKLPVASLDWPTTLGANIPELLPDLGESRSASGEASWSARLAGETTPEMADRVRENGGERAATAHRGAARDAVIRGVACDLFGSAAAPRLLLLRLSQTEPALVEQGPGSERARDAFAAVDAELWQLLVCLEWSGLLQETAVVVTGDHGVAEVHTEIAPNVTLAGEGLVEGGPGGIAGWTAIARSNGGSAFVYARSEDAVLRARAALSVAADRSGAFRVVGAEEMIESGADREAWFGLEAKPGFAFRDAASGPLLSPSARRGAGGYLPGRPQMDTALVAWGAGIRRGLRIPEMRETDVAPTFARLLGLELAGVPGRALVGVLTPESLRPAGSEPR
jgi:predicted AlkP superfamily pyrophosphatase or phosphodiesterase